MPPEGEKTFRFFLVFSLTFTCLMIAMTASGMKDNKKGMIP
jgi:hypothetical protein